MNKQELIELLQAGKVDEFNQFRADNPDFIPNFCGANLYNTNLSNINLSNADLSNANFHYANLECANLYKVNLIGANFKFTNLNGTNLYAARFDKQQIAMLPELLGIKVIED